MLAGCWDVVNIEDRGFIIGNAIDIEDEGNAKNPELAITNQMVIPGMTAPSQNEGGEKNAFINYTSTGKSIYAMEEELASVSSNVPYFEHFAVLVVSEDVARQEHLLSNLLDTYVRNVNLRRGIKVVVSGGKAKEFLDYSPADKKLPILHIEDILEKSSEQVGFLKPKVIGDIEEFHLRENSYILPYLQLNEYIDYIGGAVFHGPLNKMVGLFHEEEMEGLEMLKREHTTKIIEFPYKEKTFALKVVELDNKISVDPKNINDINVTIDIEIKGIIKEAFNQEDLTKPSEIDSIQHAVSNKVEKTIQKTLKKGQEELGADVFDIWQELETKHYDTWKQVKDDWEKGEYYFKNVNFDVNVTTEIFSIGTTNKTK